MSQDTEDVCREVFKADMKTSDLMTDLITDHEPEEIEDSVVTVVEDNMSEISDPRRQIAFLSTVRRIGQLIESKNLVQFAETRIEQWREQHG